MWPLQPLGQRMQFCVAATESLELGHRRQHVFRVWVPSDRGPGGSDTNADRATACRHIEGGRDRPHRSALRSSRSVCQQRDVAQHLEIDRCRLLALAQIGDGFSAIGSSDPEREPAAGAAAIQTEHQSGPLRSSAMDEGIDAQRAVQSGDPGRHLVEK